MPLDPVFEDFFESLDLSLLRVNRPEKFIFLCGGSSVAPTSNTRQSLRQYLINKPTFEKRIGAKFVLAEKANTLYRETKYTDLVAFESDIASIASIVLVITESAGSLAELGAFSLHESIKYAVRVVIQDIYYSQESFIRYGPIQLLNNIHPDRIGVFPWRVSNNGRLIIRSIEPHYTSVTAYIRKHVDASPLGGRFSKDEAITIFLSILWILHLLHASTISELEEYVERIFPAHGYRVRDLLYCMELSEWTSSLTYGPSTYYFSTFDYDPFDYRFKKGTSNTDSRRWKASVGASLKRNKAIPKHVLTRVAAFKKGGRT